MNERSQRQIQKPRRLIRRVGVFTTVLLGAAIVAGPAQAENAFAKRSAQAFDLIVVRPLGVGRMLFGVVCFIPAIFVSDDSSSMDETWDFFVGDQFEATFRTPLGEPLEE